MVEANKKKRKKSSEYFPHNFFPSLLPPQQSHFHSVNIQQGERVCARNSLVKLFFFEKIREKFSLVFSSFFTRKITDLSSVSAIISRVMRTWDNSACAISFFRVCVGIDNWRVRVSPSKAHQHHLLLPSSGGEERRERLPKKETRKFLSSKFSSSAIRITAEFHSRKKLDFSTLSVMRESEFLCVPKRL